MQEATSFSSTPSSRAAGALHPQQVALLALNALGGAAVMGSYAVGLFGSGAPGAAALWGGVPEAVRPIYTVNMLLAAGGYFLFTPYIALRLDPGSTRIADRFGYRTFLVLYALVLLPSALWLPLTGALVAAPSPLLWAAVRCVLAAVALGSLGLLVAVLSLSDGAPRRGRKLAVVGLVPFCLQTALLDGVVWIAMFPDLVP